jgi:phosphate transport system substrate-binding protein
MRKTFVLTMAALVASIAGCGPAQPQTPKTPTNSVTVKGSDTMVHLVTAWAENFMRSQPGSEVSVTGGGSGTGIAALLNKTTGICAASREMSASEKEQAKQKGINPHEYIVARDGIALVVNPANPVNELTMEQLKKIFTGALTDWSQVGGGKGAFILLSRESSSGTFVFFQEHVLKKEDYAPQARLMPATSAIIQSVAEDANAIGYAGLGYALEAGVKVKVLRVKADDAAPSIQPSEDTVRNATYSISRPLYLYAGDPAGKAITDFVQFCLSDAGQKIVREAGYVSVK